MKSALSTQVLEDTVTEWPLRSDIDETDSDSSSDEVYPKSNLLSCFAIHFALVKVEVHTSDVLK